jgi:hypothetical protein
LSWSWFLPNRATRNLMNVTSELKAQYKPLIITMLQSGINFTAMLVTFWISVGRLSRSMKNYEEYG